MREIRDVRVASRVLAATLMGGSGHENFRDTYYWIHLTKHVAAVFMTQVLPFADDHTLRVYRQFERGIYGAVEAG